jgi:hypothetical protein
VRFVTPILSLLAILAVGVNFWLDYRRDSGGEGSASLAGSPSLAGRIAAESMRFSVDGVSDSVFLVVVDGVTDKQRYGSATAFLVDGKCGVFATNAHVAETVTPDSRVVLRQPGTDVELEVTGAKIHPAYKRMREIYDESGPILEYRRTKKGNEFDNAVPNLQFDFGLLYVQTNPGEKDCKLPEGVTLPKALSLASQEELSRIRAGDPIAVFGYPASGNFSASLAPLAALPRVDFGTIRAIGSLLPPAKAGEPQRTVLDTVLFHSAATIGGSSGSPVVAPSGHVIAVHARGIASTGTGRAYQEGAADSVEALRLMLDGTAEAAVPQYASAILARAKAYVPISAYARLNAIDTIKASAKRFGMREDISDGSATQFEFGPEAPGVCLSQGGSCFAAETFARAFSAGRYAVVDITLDTARANVLSAVDFDQDVDISGLTDDQKKSFGDQRGITFMCPVMIVQLEPGKEPGSHVFARSSDFETFPSLLVPAEHKGQKETKIALYRPPFCSPNFARAQLVVTPFELRPGPRDDQVSLLDELSGALAGAVNAMGDAVLPADWREDEGGPR